MEYLNTTIRTIKEGEAIIIAKLDGKILSCNKEALDLYRCASIKVFREHNVSDLMPDDFKPFHPVVMTPEHLNLGGFKLHVSRRLDGELFASRLYTHYQIINGSKYLIGHVIEVKENVDIEKLCLQQNILVLERELEAERKKNKQGSFQHISHHLAKSYPSLSPNDLKLCHLLMINYSTKRIADELNITKGGVFAARKRIRKKMNLSPDDDLLKALVEAVD
ncbi:MULTISPECIES: helix-turn-helix transcriptional regulator [unclassified Carboxylicivirga]|uniref:helix-turn-helix transcriptional regulator n=1 Tax=Carboxylicivirga TaxID=1628153 RepID=UPI003D35491F